MRARLSVVAAAATMMLALALPVRAASSGEALADDAGAPSLPACVLVTTDARYVPYGYNHIVILKNGCSKAATCSVATDVSPQSSSVEVAAQTTVEVLTFTASPAQTFSARVSCKLH